MEVLQAYEYVNLAAREALGREAVNVLDEQGLVDTGDEIFASDKVDAYVRTLVNHIGRVKMVNRTYKGSAPSVLREGWEFGSVLEKITAELPEAEVTQDWELHDGESYDPNIFTKPEVSVKFFNSKVTYTVKISVTELQVKQSFSNSGQLVAFLSMIENNVDKARTLRNDALIKSTINNFTAETIYNEYEGGDLTAKSGVRAVNLFYLFKQKYPDYTKTALQALEDPDFIRFAAIHMSKYIERLKDMNTLYNIGGKARFTPSDMLHVVMLSEFAANAEGYLYADTWHDNFVKLPQFEKINFWQGTGTGYELDAISKINVTNSEGHTVNTAGILCVMFDTEALMVANENSRVRTNYVPVAEFMNYWYKFDCSYFNDFNENFVVFFVA